MNLCIRWLNCARSQKKESAQPCDVVTLLLFFWLKRLFVTRMNSTHWANACACAAIQAKIRVDMINITLNDSSCRALADTCTASYAVSLWDFVSHNTKFLLIVDCSGFGLLAKFKPKYKCIRFKLNYQETTQRNRQWSLESTSLPWPARNCVCFRRAAADRRDHLGRWSLPGVQGVAKRLKQTSLRRSYEDRTQGLNL